MSNYDYQKYSPKSEESDFREIIDAYLVHWRWFLATVLLSLTAAILYLRYTQPSYIAFSTVIIEDEESKGPSANTSTFADLGILRGLSTSSIENELGLLRSKRLMTNAVKALDLNVRYFAEEGIPRREIYKKAPFQIRLMRMDENLLNDAILEEKNEFIISSISDDTVKITFDQENNNYINAKLGEIIDIKFAEIVVEKNDVSQENSKYKTSVIKFGTVASAVSSYQSKLSVELLDENSTLIQLSMVDNVKLKAQDILNQLVFQYNQEAIEDKDLLARNTAFFIDERLDIINSELDSVESGKEKFKEFNSLTDIQAESTLIIQNASDYNNRQQAVNTELELTNAFINHLKSNDTNLLPTNLGLDESGSSVLIDEYNALVLERNRIREGATEQNPRLLTLNDRIRELKSNVDASLRQRKSNLLISRDNIRRQAGILGSQISEVPGQEREYRGIERQQNIKEALFMFLLTKREENSLSLAAKAPKAKLVDQAYSRDDPIAPNPKIILFLAVLLGLFVPFAGINAVNLLNNKIRDKEDFKKLSKNIPIIGEIPSLNKKDKRVIIPNQRTVLAESFGILGSNLQYLEDHDRPGNSGTIIFVTSSVKGEGKTFTSINLSISFAIAGKKVLVIGGDLRNPQLTKYEKSKINTGLSDYLSDPNLKLEDLILDSSLHPNLNILNSGNIPPNPMELLRKPKLDKMFKELKEQYDYIIVDTAPAMLLADTFLISRHANLTLYVVRAGFTKKKSLEFATEAQRDGKIKKMGFLLNDVTLSKSNYGYTYGYKYGKK